MECPHCGRPSTSTESTRSWAKPGRGNEKALSAAAIAAKTRYFTLRRRSCAGCGWTGETMELTSEHLRWLLAHAQKEGAAGALVEPLELRVSVQGGRLVVDLPQTGRALKASAGGG